MSEDLTTAARAEEQRLLEQLRANPLFCRLEAVRGVLAAYGEPKVPAHAQFAGTRSRRASSRAGSLTSQVIAIAEAYLRREHRRAQSLEILQVLLARGIEIKRDKPTTIVASILSHCDLFDNVRGEGYGLREWSAESSLPDESEEALGDAANDEPNREHNIDRDTQSGLHNNWATGADRPWPRNGS